MEILKNLFYGFPDLWGGGVAHSVMILSLVIALGLCLGKLRVKGVSLGLAWILFIGLIFGHFSLNLDEHLLHFLKEFGLILFVYSIGLEVGPGFFASFKNGGKSLNLLSMIVVALSIITTLVIFSFSGTSITSMAGILSGAVTNTPGLGAAQQAFSDLRHIDAPSIAAGYAIAYPMGVLGVILSFIILRFALRVDKQKEEDEAKRGKGHLEAMTLNTFAVKVSNQMVFKDTVKQIRYLLKRDFMVSKIIRNNGERQNEVVNGQTVIEEGDILQIVAHPTVEEPIIALLGEKVDVKDEEFSSELINRRILITKPGINGKSISQLQIRSNLGANITRVNRNGVDLIATPDLKLQLGDRVTVVGKELAIAHTEKVLGNQMKRLNYPNLIPIFLGIMLGCIVANIPFFIPGINENLRLGLTGGPLVVAILIGYFGPKYNLVTYNTISANLMLREIGICIFLACVGLGTGEQFIQTVASESGLTWILYGIAITMIPIILGGIIGKLVFHINYYTLLGVLAGANTNPSALAYVREQTSADAPTVGYANVYPFAMFLRIVTIQIIIFVFGQTYMTETELKTCACIEDNCNCKEIAESELRRKLDLLLRTGSILMESAADTSRIMRTMKRAAAFLGLDERYMHLYINWNVLMVNYSDEEHSFSKFQRCEKHGINLTSISQVSKLTWKAIKDNYSLEQYEQALNDIKATPRSFTPWQVAIGGGFACGGFCIQFGCDWPAFFFCSLAAILGFRLRMFLPTKGCNNYVAIGISAFVATLIAWLTSFLSLNPSIAEALPAFMHSDTPWHPLMACALFIVPGVPLINFVCDMLDGYIEVGMVRALNTLLMLFAMAFGIAFAIQVCHIDNFVKDLTMTPHHEYWEFAIAAAVSAMGFSTIFSIPRRLLPVVAVGGIIAVCFRNFVNLGPSNGNIGLDMGLSIGSLAGSALISIIVIKARHWFHTPHQCITIPSVIPMVPGVLMYRALFAFIDMHGVVGEVTVGMNNLIKASLAIICIALGVAIPNVFFRRFIADNRKRKLLAMLVERKKKNGEFVDLHEAEIK